MISMKPELNFRSMISFAKLTAYNYTLKRKKSQEEMLRPAQVQPKLYHTLEQFLYLYQNILSYIVLSIGYLF